MVIGVCDKSSELVKNNQDNNFHHFNLSNLDSILVNRNPGSDKELANKVYVDDSSSGKVFSFNQTPENYLEVSVGKDSYNFTKNDELQIRDTTETKLPNIRSNLL